MSAIIEEIKKYDLPQKLREELGHLNDLSLASLSSAADQLKAVGGDRSKLTIGYMEEELNNECKLGTLPWEATKAARNAGRSFEVSLHDPLTLIKAKTFLGCLIETLGNKEAKKHGLRSVWASADLDYFKTVNDKWSHAHGDRAIVLVCRIIQALVDTWNANNAAIGHAVAMRFGGDEIVLCIVLLRGADVSACRPLMNEVHAKVCEDLQKHFEFGSLASPPLDRNGNVIVAKGPAISIGLSAALPCGNGPNALFVKGFKRADDLLNEYKEKWKEGKTDLGTQRELGGGVIFEDDILGAKAGDAEVPIRVLADKTASGTEKEQAAGALVNLSVNADNQVAIVQAGGLPRLISLLADGTPVGKEKAAAALWNLAANAENQVAIVQAGGLPRLISLLADGTPVAKEEAAAALGNLAANDDNEVAIAQAGGLPRLISLLADGTPVAKEKSAAALLNLSYNTDNKLAIVQAGGLPRLISLLADGTPVAKEKAEKTLKMLAKNGDIKAAIANAGGPVYN